ncbi:hypothetical protein VPH35_105101 [Triticum aestivum]
MSINALFGCTSESTLRDGWAPLKGLILGWCSKQILDGRSSQTPWSGRCPLRDQTTETLSDMLTECPFVRQVWHEVFSPLSLQATGRQSGKTCNSWFEQAATCAGEGKLRGARSLNILLTMWRAEKRLWS